MYTIITPAGPVGPFSIFYENQNFLTRFICHTFSIQRVTALSHGEGDAKGRFGVNADGVCIDGVSDLIASLFCMSHVLGETCDRYARDDSRERDQIGQDPLDEAVLSHLAR